MIKVTLTREEQLVAALVAAIRMIDSKEKGLDSGSKDRDWRTEIEGAMAEAAVARIRGNYFDPRVGRYKEPDVGPFHVRQTERHDGRLIIRDDDKAGQYLLVTGSLGEYRIIGWANSEKARANKAYRDKPNPHREEATCVPQRDLIEATEPE